MKAARRLAEHFHKSSQATAALAKLCAALDISPRRVTQDVETRWWSTYAMLESLLYLKQPMVAYKDKLPKDCVLTDEQWAVLATIASVLQPMMIVQKNLEGDHYVTGSLMIPFVHDIRQGLLEASIAAEDGSVSGNTLGLFAVSTLNMCCIDSIASLHERERCNTVYPDHMYPACMQMTLLPSCISSIALQTLTSCRVYCCNVQHLNVCSW